ncbi:hypothetical protein M117_1156 [Bacteroides fragilis str. 3774 T13]|uniref:Uncharacterized protein n=1 Tax=Alistipes putredinis DSM 17216 TaxID=445970 RepID=B0MUM9_9BACT|nr:hypothetical protein ALIPUT_00848 [Alistipes putredinis DSM 17216]EXY41833.1 hypothetical protein M117_1156 [Bacteroides fragilis str. 3774 T13]
MTRQKENIFDKIFVMFLHVITYYTIFADRNKVHKYGFIQERDTWAD